MDDLPKVNSVRAIIDLFEVNCKNETAQRLNKSMSKSFAGLSFTERKLKSYSSKDYDIINLELRLSVFSDSLKNYKVYAKDIHVALHEELVEIMAILLNIENKNNNITYAKKEFMFEVKAHFRALNDMLPSSLDITAQGFGDSTYKPWQKPVISRLNSQFTNNDSSENISPLRLKTQRSKSVTNRDTENSPRTPSSSTRSPGFLIGGTAGTRHSQPVTSPSPTKFNREVSRTPSSPSTFKGSPDFIIGGPAGTRYPQSSSAKSNKEVSRIPSTRGSVEETPDFIIGGLAGTRFQSSSSVGNPSTPSASKESADFIIGGPAGTRYPRSSSAKSNEEASRIPSTPGSVEETPDFIIGGLAGTRYQSSSSVGTPPTPSASKESPDFIIGGPAGTRYAQSAASQNTATFNAPKKEVSETRRPQSIGFDSMLRGRSELQPKRMERSTSEEPDNIRVKPIGSSGWSNADRRRRPVSLGGTIVTLNSAEDIISSMRSSQNYVRDTKNEEQADSTVRNRETDDSLQSVNLLKRFFEMKSTEKLQREKSFDVEEDQAEEFENYVVKIDNTYQTKFADAEENVEISSNETVVAENDEEDDDVIVITSRSMPLQVDEIDGLNTPVLRHEVVDDDVVLGRSVDDDVILGRSVHDDVVLGRSVDDDVILGRSVDDDVILGRPVGGDVILGRSANDDVDERVSFCSEHSIYLDPVD